MKDNREPMSVGMIGWLTAAYFFIGLIHFAHAPAWILPLSAGCVAWRWRVARGKAHFPPSWVRTTLAVLLIIGLILDRKTLFGVDAGTAFMLGLIGIKFLEVRSKRDYILVCFTCYFLVFAELLFTQTLPICLYLAAAIVVITAALGRGQTRERQEASFEQLQEAARLLLPVLPLAIFLFLFFPRPESRFTLPLGGAQTGLTDHMEPGSIADLTASEEVAFRAEFPRGNMPSHQEQYWRALVLWRTDGQRWRRGDETLFRAKVDVKEGRAVLQRITLWPSAEKFLFALDLPIEIYPKSFLLPGSILIESESVFSHRRVYLVNSMVNGISQEMNGSIRALALQLPPRDSFDPRVLALVDQWKREGGRDAKIAERALRFFHDQGFQYSSSPGIYGPNFLGEFLFEGKTGFCEHYASAFCLLMRLAGVPARLVVGYQGGDENPYGNFIVVRQSNAHAWTEVWLENQGWIRVDPTAVLVPTRISEGARTFSQSEQPGFRVRIAGHRFELFRSWRNPAWWRQWRGEVRARWDWVEDRWDDWVLKYDRDRQIRLLSKLNPLEWNGNQIIAILLVGFLSIGAFWTWQYWSHREPNPVLREYQRLCRILEKKGVPRRPWEGPLAFSQRAAEIWPERKSELEECALFYSQMRYGPQSFSKKEVKELAEKIDRLKC